MSNLGTTEDQKIFNHTLGKNIKYLRKQKGFNQTRIGKVIGTSFQQVQKYEKGQNGLSAEKLILFCQHYEINLNSFVEGDPYQVLDGATIPSHYKERALTNIEKLEEVKNDKGRSYEDMVGQSLNPRTYL